MESWSDTHVPTEEKRLVQIVAHIISNLAVDPRNQQELLEAGVIDLLMPLLGDVPYLTSVEVQLASGVRKEWMRGETLSTTVVCCRDPW